MTRVFAIILNYNGAEASVRCAEAVLRSEDVEVELLIVDNASPDQSGAALGRRFGDEHVLRLPDNRGYAGGMNAGLAHWREHHAADLVLLLTQDVLLGPRTLRDLIAVLDARPRAGAVGPILLLEADSTVFSAGGTCDPGRVFVDHHRTPQSSEPYEVPWLDGCCILLRSTAVDAVVGFDDAYFLYFEDVDLGMRLRRAGWSVLVTPQARVTQAKDRYIPRHTIYYTSRNRYRFWKAHYRLPWHRVVRTLAREVASGGKALAISVFQPSLHSEVRPRLWFFYHKMRGAWHGTLDHLFDRYGPRPF